MKWIYLKTCQLVPLNSIGMEQIFTNFKGNLLHLLFVYDLVNFIVIDQKFGVVVAKTHHHHILWILKGHTRSSFKKLAFIIRLNSVF